MPLPLLSTLKSLAIGIFLFGLFPVTASAQTPFNAVVTRIVDGDTLRIRYEGEERPIRFLCIEPQNEDNRLGVIGQNNA